MSAHGLRSALAFPLTSEGLVVAVIALYGRLDRIDGALLEALADIGGQVGQFMERTRVDAALKASQEHLRESLHHQAFHDALTGLPNRALLDDRLAEAMELARRERRRLGLLVLDLDGFKAVNDRFGHVEGDRVLIQAADLMRASVRGADTVARLGGDEFAIIPQGDMGPLELTRLARKISRAFDRAGKVTVRQPSVRPSIGSATFPEDAASGPDLIRAADAAMYHAKRDGLDFAIFHKGMTMALTGRLTLVDEERTDEGQASG